GALAHPTVTSKPELTSSMPMFLMLKALALLLEMNGSLIIYDSKAPGHSSSLKRTVPFLDELLLGHVTEKGSNGAARVNRVAVTPHFPPTQWFSCLQSCA